MGFNPSPEVAAARDFGEKFGVAQVVILYRTADGLGYASWGKTRTLCEATKELADVAYEAVWDRLARPAGA